MARWNKAAVLAALAGGALAGFAGLALAQGAPGTPPSWDTLVRCAELGDRDSRLACYDDAMRAAGYAPKPEAVAAARRKLFGLSTPQLLKRKHGKAEAAPGETAEAAPAQERKSKGRKAEAPAPAPVPEDENNVAVTLAKVATQGTGKLLMITEEGQIWEQTDSERVIQLPKEGSVMPIHRGTFGGYFCDITKYKSVRCARIR